ncbi:MAG: DUF4363 family protein [Oscillospiraceae bacterium]|nr:DUF4363 family protein [Oscillospiraceae bacterium]
MKRGWLGAGILAVFFSLGLAVSVFAGRAHQPTGKLLEQAAEKTLAGDFEGGVALAMEAKERWKKQWNGTASIADHSPMDEVDALFAEMEVYARTGEEPHFAACCKELAQRLEAIAGAHRFSWWNVL